MKLKYLIFLIYISSLGCSAQNSSFTPKSLSLGIYDNGMPFINWEGMLYHSVTVNGTVFFPIGSKLVASFGESSDEIEIQLDLVVKMDDKNQLVIIGDYVSKSSVPFRVLGIVGSDDDLNTMILLDKPSGEIKLERKLDHFYVSPDHKSLGN